jgi:signal transduction histidine kinase
MVAVGGLLVAIIIAGLIGFWQTRSMELEDEGDDIRAAILDVRHYHRNVYFNSLNTGRITRDGIDDYEAARARLYEEIDELAGVKPYDPDAPQPEDFRRWADEYYAGFRPLLQPTVEDKEAFDTASDRGLEQIEQMEQKAGKLDGLGESLTDGALQRVDRAAATSELVLLGAIFGLLLAGAALAYAAVRVVNELKRLYAGQQETAAKLAEASRQKTDFLADVSHELRTPLTVLRGNAQVGLALGAEGEQKQLLEEVVEESKRMSRMVEELLFLARSDSSPPSLEPETVSVPPLMSDLVGRATVLARERGATLATDVRADGLLHADPNRLEQAVLILVDNAIKYGPPGGTVTLHSAVTRAGELRITVEDEGPGIPKEDLPRVFERFYRVDKARSRRMGGSGLGLPIAKTIVEAHGGHITAESRAGHGTRMSIHLPLASDAPDAEPAASGRELPQKAES